MAHLWAKWLRHPCRLGDPHGCRAGGKIRSGPLVGKVATSPLPSRGSPPLQSGGGGGGDQKWPTCGQSGYVTPAVPGIPTAAEPGENQKWPTSEQSGYVTPAVSGIPTAAERGGGGQKWPTCGQSGYVTPAVSGIPTASKQGAKSEVAHLWAKWLRHPCRLGDPHRFKAGGKIRSGPLVGKVATSPLPSRGSPPLQSGGQNQKWPTCGQSGYVTPAVSGIPTAAERGGGGQKWPICGQSGYVTPAVSGIPTAAEPGENQKWPTSEQSGYVTPAVSGIPTASERGGGDQKWPTCGQSGYVTPAVSGIPTASERGAKSEVAHLWAKWLRHPCRLGDPHRFKAGGKLRSGPLVGKVATSPLPSQGSPPLQSGGEIRSGPLVGKVATSPLPSGGSPPLQSGGGGGSEVAHKWAKWLRHPCRLGDPHRFRAGGKIRSGPLVGKVATSPLPSRGSPPLHSRGEIRSGKWLRHPCRLGDPHRFRAGSKIRSGPLVGKVATSPLPSRGSPRLKNGGQNQKWPTSEQSGYVTPAVSGIPTASERGGGGIRSGPLVGKVATSPLPSRGSPPLQSGGQNQKWPTSGQGGYGTLCVSVCLSVCVSLSACVCVCVYVWVHGCVGAWVRGCVGAWVRACVCVRCPIISTKSTVFAIIHRLSTAMPVCVCVCVTPKSFKLCSNCEVQQLHPTTR